MTLSLTLSTADGHEHAMGTPVKPPSCDAQLLRRTSGRLLGKLDLVSGVTSLTLSAYPLREWHVGARQLTLLDEPVQPRLARLREALRALQQRFGEAVIRLASLVGPPLPLNIEVGLRPDGTPMWLRWGGWARFVEQVYEYWREQQSWWDRPVTRDYYHIEINDELVFTVFRDSQGRWFLDRRHG